MAVFVSTEALTTTCNTRKHLQQSCRYMEAQAVTSKGSTWIKTSAELGMELPPLSRKQEASGCISVSQVMC